MATIADLHTSISEMTDEKIFTLIRHLRSLRREIPVRIAKKPAKKKSNKKQLTFNNYVSSVKDTKREELLKKLLEIKKRRK